MGAYVNKLCERLVTGGNVVQFPPPTNFLTIASRALALVLAQDLVTAAAQAGFLAGRLLEAQSHVETASSA